MRSAISACRVASHMASTSRSAWRAQQSSIWGGVTAVVGQHSPVKPSATQTEYAEQSLGGGPLAGSATSRETREPTGGGSAGGGGGGGENGQGGSSGCAGNEGGAEPTSHTHLQG